MELTSVFLRLESRDVMLVYSDGTSKFIKNCDKEFVQVTRDPTTQKLLFLVPANTLDIPKI